MQNLFKVTPCNFWSCRTPHKLLLYCWLQEIFKKEVWGEEKNSKDVFHFLSSKSMWSEHVIQPKDLEYRLCSSTASGLQPTYTGLVCVCMGEWMPPLWSCHPFPHQQYLPTKTHLEHSAVDITVGSSNQLHVWISINFSKEEMQATQPHSCSLVQKQWRTAVSWMLIAVLEIIKD